MPPSWEDYDPPVFDPDEEAAAAIREAEQAARGDDTERHYAEQQRRASLRRYGKESARRRKLFARAKIVLEAAAVMRNRVVTFSGVKFSGDVMELGPSRTGQPWGLTVNIGPDHEMEWTPRGGYRIVETQPLPF